MLINRPFPTSCQNTLYQIRPPRLRPTIHDAHENMTSVTLPVFLCCILYHLYANEDKRLWISKSLGFCVFVSAVVGRRGKSSASSSGCCDHHACVLPPGILSESAQQSKYSDRIFTNKSKANISKNQSAPYFRSRKQLCSAHQLQVTTGDNQYG